MALPPYPILPSPHSWAANDVIFASTLNNDAGNAIQLLAQPPLFLGQQTLAAQFITAGAGPQTLTIDTESLDAWNMHATATGKECTAQLPGYYLCEGMTETTAIPNTASLTTGFQGVLTGVTTNRDGASISSNGTTQPGATGAELFAMGAGDTCAMYASVIGTTSPTVQTAQFKMEWVAAQSGTIVNPASVAQYAPAAGTTCFSVAQGDSTIQISGTTAGLVTGGEFAIEYGTARSETFIINGISGSVIFPNHVANFSHPLNSKVTVPVSSAFLNRQVRDMIRFLAYRPVACLTSAGTIQSVGNPSFPGASVVQLTSAPIDNYGGWNGVNAYNFPVAGLYYIYGQVAFNNSSNYTAAAGITISGGTTLWGDSIRNNTSTNYNLSPTVRRHVRVASNDYVELQANQNTAGGLGIQSGSQTHSKLIVIWRGF